MQCLVAYPELRVEVQVRSWCARSRAGLRKGMYKSDNRSESIQTSEITRASLLSLSCLQLRPFAHKVS